MFEPVKTYSNLSDGIVNQIMEEISHGNLKPGNKLPSEREMCSVFSVSRTVVRDALKTLAGLGIVTIRHGMGAYINEVDAAEDVSRLSVLLQISQGTLEELFQIREILESKAAYWCAQNAKDDDIQYLEDIVRKGKELNEGSKLSLLDAEFHLKIVEAAGNKVLMRLMVNLLDLTGEIRGKVLEVPGRQRLSVLEHEMIVEAVKQRDPDLAYDSTLQHLTKVQKAIQSVNQAPKNKD